MATPSRFTPIEVMSNQVNKNLPKSLQVSANSLYYKALLVRLLTGTMNIHCELTSKTISQRNNYSLLSFQKNKRISPKIIKQAIDPYTLQQLDKNITGNMRRNTRFYRELFFEFCSYFYQMNNKNNIAGFLHLYRILERISYSFPLVWAARATDFEGTFTKLKSYFEAKGELGVFKRFIKDSIDSTYLQTPVQFHIQSVHPDWQKIYFQTITEVLNSIDRNSIVSSTPNSLIETRYDHLVDMTVTIRNKYFHFLSGMNNSFTSDHIIDPNEFFAIINENIANWLSFIYFEILEHELSL